jgi:hypothetical protein
VVMSILFPHFVDRVRETSSTSRTARSRISSAYFRSAGMTPPSCRIGVSTKPGAIQVSGPFLLHLTMRTPPAPQPGDAPAQHPARTSRTP